MKEIFVERRENLLRIAIKKKGRLEVCIVEEEIKGPVIGQIYKGRVKNIIPGAKAIFVDIGLSKEAYLYYDEKLKSNKIKKGDELIVEIVKEPLADKGAKITTNFSIPSKYMVIESEGEGISFSKRFKDEIKKEIIKAELEPVENAKLIMRTESANVDIEELKNERALLINEFNEINRKMKFSSKLGKIYGENLTLTKVLRDEVNLDEVKLILNDNNDYEYAAEYLSKQQNISIELYDDERGMFEKYNIESELIKLRHNKVILPSGGSIVIDKTEAMYVIDVNSGKNTKHKTFEEAILKTNVEAAKEIGRQIFLRNLSGIIVVDFIDQREKANRSLVLRELKDSIKDDGGNIKVFPFTELNLVQISRKRRGKSVYEYMDEKCDHCFGAGRILKLSYLEGLINNEIVRYSKENSIDEFLIEIDSIYQKRVQEDIVSFLKNICGLGKKIYVNYITNIDGYRVEPLIFQNQKKNIEKYLIKIE